MPGSSEQMALFTPPSSCTSQNVDVKRDEPGVTEKGKQMNANA